MSSLVEVQAVGHSYGDFAALTGVSFSIAAGEIFGLLGPNGAGKTTLLSLLAALRSPTHGAIQLAGQRLHPNHHALKRKIGLVPQELALYPELTAAENLRFFGALYRLPNDELERRVAKILEMIGLTERADARVSTFSGGMQRRLNLGISLVHEPTLLLLDEPTAGVDPQSRNHLFEGIRRLHASGMTIVYTSHYMEEVEALCQRVGIIDHGRLVACDSVSGLLGLLPGTIHFDLSRDPEGWDGLLDGDGRLEKVDDGWHLRCRDVSPMVVRLVAWCSERKLTLTRLETEAPNLERVFLHLTGRALRD
jgi:ABC-2 type transport system ATP-binding protein